MVWDAINTLIALASLGIAVWAFYRTLLAGHPVVELLAAAATCQGDPVVLYLKISNPGRHALLLHGLRFRSPRRDEVSWRVLEDSGTTRRAVELAYKATMVDGNEDEAPLDAQVKTGSAATVEVTLPNTKRPLDASLHWSKSTRVVFPWRPIRIKRSPQQLQQLADAAGELI